MRRSRSLVVAGHQQADGDCLGAEAVLFHAFRALGKAVRVVNPDPVDPRYDFLAGHTPYEVYGGPASLGDYDALFVCDCSTLDRLGAMGQEVLRRPGARVAVDHHVLDEADRRPWTCLIHDAAAPAAGLVAYRLAQALGASLPSGALEGLFVSLATDTGWFRYGNAGPEAWAVAAELVAAGVRPERVYGAIYQRNEPSRPFGIAAALQNLEYHRAGRVALAWLAEDSVGELRAGLGETEDVLDILRSVDPVEVVALVTQRAPGQVKANLRSKGNLDVNLVARSLGGGGHPRAAGVTFPPGTTLPAAVDAVRARLLSALDSAALER